MVGIAPSYLKRVVSGGGDVVLVDTPPTVGGSDSAPARRLLSYRDAVSVSRSPALASSPQLKLQLIDRLLCKIQRLPIIQAMPHPVHHVGGAFKHAPVARKSRSGSSPVDAFGGGDQVSLTRGVASTLLQVRVHLTKVLDGGDGTHAECHQAEVPAPALHSWPTER